MQENIYKGKLICLIGISGSGKSTIREKILLQLPDTHVISRDELREQLYGYDDSNINHYYSRGDIGQCEQYISYFSELIIEKTNCKNILIDNTNLSEKYLKEFQNLAKKTNREFLVYTLHTDKDLAILRDSERDRTVGTDVIEKQYKQYESLVTNKYWNSLTEFELITKL